MLVSTDLAVQMLDLPNKESLWSNPKLKALLIKTGDGYKADTDKIEAYQDKKFQDEDTMYQMTSLAEYVIRLKGKDFFCAHFTKQEAYKLTQYLKVGLLSLPYSHKIKDIFYNNFKDLHAKNYKQSMIPHKDRVPLTESFIKKHYWDEKKTVKEIAQELNVPTHWVEKEISRLGLQKSKNGVKRKGRKGYIPPPNWGKDRENQPHRKEVCCIDPITFKTVKMYRSICAVRHDGFNRENVRKAIKRGGLSFGYLWALKGMEAPTIAFAKKQGNIQRKIQIHHLKTPTKEKMHELYVVQKLHTQDIANILGCSRATVAQYACKMGLKRKVPPMNEKTLREEYLTNNLTAQEIANKYGKTKQTVATYLSRLGIHKRQSKGKPCS